MHTTKQGNAYHQTGTTIPDINSDINLNINTTAATANLKAIFNSIDSNLVFDKEFYPAAVLFMHNYSVSDFAGYCKWLYEQVKAKSPNNFRGYYYKVFFLADNILAYKVSETQEGETKAQETKNQRKCPVCGTSILTRVWSCPCCGLETNDFENEREIAKWKKYMALPDDRKKEYEGLKKKIIENAGIKNHASMSLKLEELDIKYGLTEDI